MINNIILALLLGFAVAADCTLQQPGAYNGIDWYPDALKPKVEEVVFDRIEQIGPDMYLPISDTIYMLNEKIPKLKKK
jgi:hypothetical protein